MLWSEALESRSDVVSGRSCREGDKVCRLMLFAEISSCRGEEVA